MKFQLSRLFLLLAGTVSTLLISGHVGAVSSPNSRFNEVKSAASSASNSAEKTNLPAAEMLVAKKKIKIKIVIKARVEKIEPQQFQVAHLATVDTFSSLTSSDTLG